MAFSPRTGGDATDIPPGSTFKIITTAAAVVSKPADLTKSFDSDRGACTTLPDSNKLLCNSGGEPVAATSRDAAALV